MPEALCPCFAMPTPHRHATAELSTRETDRPPPAVELVRISSRIVIKYRCGYSALCRKPATHYVEVAGRIVDYACGGHLEPKHWARFGAE